jgi:hypothetical protein
MNKFIKDELSSELKTYTEGGSISKLGVVGGKYVIKVSYDVDYNDIIEDIMLNPDDDGNHYVGKWGWFATKMGAMKTKKSPIKSKSKSSPTRCPKGSRRDKKKGKCIYK